MKSTNRLIKIGRNILAALLMTAGAATLPSCEDDAPEYTHTAADLADSWVCSVKEGDMADGFQMEVYQTSDNEFVIKNFHNCDGEEVSFTISGNKISFNYIGCIDKDCPLKENNIPHIPMFDHSAVVTNGSGNITNGWLTMTLSYDITTDDEPEHFEVELNKGKALSKKAVAINDADNIIKTL